MNALNGGLQIYILTFWPHFHVSILVCHILVTLTSLRSIMRCRDKFVHALRAKYVLHCNFVLSPFWSFKSLLSPLMRPTITKQKFWYYFTSLIFDELGVCGIGYILFQHFRCKCAVSTFFFWGGKIYNFLPPPPPILCRMKSPQYYAEWSPPPYIMQNEWKRNTGGIFFWSSTQK